MRADPRRHKMVGMDGGLFGGAGGPSAGQAAAVAVRPAVEGAMGDPDRRRGSEGSGDAVAHRVLCTMERH